MTTITWQGPGVSHPSSGMWDTATNWSGGVEPGPNDSAVLPFGTYTVTLGDGASADAASVGSLTIDGDATFDIADMATLTIETSLSNAGRLVAFTGGELSLAPGSILTNNQNGTLTGGYFEADAGATLSLTGGAITTLHANIYLNGAGSLIQAGSGGSFVPLQQSLTAITPPGVLRINNLNYTTSNAISLTGSLDVSKGTFSSGLLSAAQSSVIEGDGTIASSIDSSGEVKALPNETLTLSGAADVFTGELLGDLKFSGGTVSLPNGAGTTGSNLSATIAGAEVTIGHTSDIHFITLSSGSLILNAGVELSAEANSTAAMSKDRAYFRHLVS